MAGSFAAREPSHKRARAKRHCSRSQSRGSCALGLEEKYAGQAVQGFLGEARFAGSRFPVDEKHAPTPLDRSAQSREKGRCFGVTTHERRLLEAQMVRKNLLLGVGSSRCLVHAAVHYPAIPRSFGRHPVQRIADAAAG